METTHTTYVPTRRRNWVNVNNRVQISSPNAKRVYKQGLELSDLNLVMQYGERLVEGYYLSDSALNQALANLCDSTSTGVKDRLKLLHKLVVVEIMDTVLATYFRHGCDSAEDTPLQHEFVLH